MMNSYEAMYIISPEVDEESVKALVEKFKAMIEAEGTVDSIEEWGRKKLAYLIQDFSEGYYVLVNFSAPPTFVAELERVLKITDGIIKYMITRKEQ